MLNANNFNCKWSVSNEETHNRSSWDDNNNKQ